MFYIPRDVYTCRRRVSDVILLPTDLRKIRSIADYQFGRGVGWRLFPDNVRIVHSKRTGRIRHVFREGSLLATLRPTDGLLSLSIDGASHVAMVTPHRLWVLVQNDAAEFIARRRSAFAKHVLECDKEIRPNEEVVVMCAQRKILAIGKALLAGEEMKDFQRGVAVHVRCGVTERGGGKPDGMEGDHT